MNELHAYRAPLVPADPVLRARCAQALALMHTQRGHPAAEVDRLLADDPGCLLGHCLRAALIVRGDDVDARPQLAMSITALETCSRDTTGAARRHAAAARAWFQGDAALALQRYGAIVEESPRDLIALEVAHALDFRLGLRKMLRDRVARALRGWKASLPGYASVLAMLAFGLEENGQRRRAERVARRALSFDPTHVGALHAIAHVMEMQGRARDGLAFLAANEHAWRADNGYAVHLAWHQALFHLDVRDIHAALTVYDTRIAPPHGAGLAALADASALLWRLALRNVDVGGRWRALAQRWALEDPARLRPFHAIHAMLAFAAEQHTAAAALLARLRAEDDAAAGRARPEEALTRPLCEALVCFARGDYAGCTDWLARVRGFADRCGGSLAQCDLVHLTFTEAALRARRVGLASALVAERRRWKPASPFNRLLLHRLRMALPGWAWDPPAKGIRWARG